jgi:hypothetical protein
LNLSRNKDIRGLVYIYTLYKEFICTVSAYQITANWVKIDKS